MTPDNFATGRPTVGHEKIYIEFDEFVQLKDQQKEFFTSPAMKKKPLITLRGRGIVIQLRDTLAPNTTYALNFGSAIRDNNEGNPLYSMRYVFSTGPEIDSMVAFGLYGRQLQGRLRVEELHLVLPRRFGRKQSPNTTPRSSSTNPRPSPVPRTTASSSPRTSSRSPYRVYAVQDKNDNQIYEPGSATRWVSSKGPTTLPRCPDFGMWYDSIRRYVTAEPQLYFRMFTDKAFRRQVLSQTERPLQHKAMLYFAAAHTRRSTGSVSTAFRPTG